MIARLDNPPDPWSGTSIDWIGEPPPAKLEVYLDASREILSTNDSPDIPFRFGVNPYRGCFHGCAYCYARPSHEYLSFGSGTDFERRIVVKTEAAVLLRKAFERPSWRGDVIALSGNTDCYQPLEASFKLTRACLEVCRDYSNPVGVITKSPLIERDIDLLSALARLGAVRVTVSVPFARTDHARAIEPYVPPPARRIEAIRRLADAGIPVGVNVAPVIPGLNDAELPEVMERAREAGATHAAYILLRLPGPVAGIFEKRLREALPLRAERVLSRLRDVRGGALNDPRFGSRMKGEGAYAESIRILFERTARRLGYEVRKVEAPGTPGAPSPFRRPSAGSEEHGAQLRLF